MKLCEALFGVALLGASAAPALAGEFDAQGRLDTTGSALSISFDEGLDTQSKGGLVAISGNDIPDSFFEAHESGLEGAGAMNIVPGQRGVLLTPGPEWDQFKGRRVEVTLWYKPRGTDIRASMSWYSGDGNNWLQQDFDEPAMPVGKIVFHPTGRATSDGWVELTSGEFDYEMSGVAPEWIVLREAQSLMQAQSQGGSIDRYVSVLVDALEVHDRGEALVPDVACSGATEASVCGEFGSCLVGRCVDSTAMLGHVPAGKLGDDYIARRLFELEAFAGPRAGREKLAEVSMLWESANRDSPRAYWRQVSQAHELLVDGHGSPPRDPAVQFYHPSGVCLGPGLADLSPSTEIHDTMLPMVFSADSSFDAGAMLQKGDVLVSVDGLPTWDWVGAHPEFFYYNGDSRGRQSIATLYLVNAAKTLGSTLTFERCARQDGVACEASEVEYIDVDFAQLVGSQLWLDSPPSDIFSYTNQCDMRFERGVSAPLNAASYYFTGWNDVEGVRHLMINGVPTNRGDNQGARWHNGVNSALASGPEKLVLDQRTGYGGHFEGVARIIGHLYDPMNAASAALFPWIGQEWDEETWELFRSCWSQGQGSCGSYLQVRINSSNSAGNSSSSKVAVLNGFDVSGNDYLSRFLAYRQAPTKIFGYGPAIGAYGASCSFASYLWESQAMRYQCHDTRFSASEDGTFEGYESGTGVMADEVVYQLQSDANLGEDTMIKAAHQWLGTFDDEVMQ